MFFLLGPAGVANTAPVWGAKIKGLKKWNTPLDLGCKYKGERLLGDHKTYRGIFVGVVSGCLTGVLQIYIIHNSPYLFELLEFMHGNINLILLGGLLGFFALLGDALKSFFKRRLRIAPGKSWPVMDQIDYIIGSYLLVGFLFNLTPSHYLVGLLTYALLHPAFSYTAYLLKLKKDKF